MKALPKDLPDFIEADISEMKIGAKMYITDVDTENFTFLHSDNTVICQVRTSRTAIVDEVEDEEEGEEGAEGVEGAEGETAAAEGETTEAPAGE